MRQKIFEGGTFLREFEFLRGDIFSKNLDGFREQQGIKNRGIQFLRERGGVAGLTLGGWAPLPLKTIDKLCYQD